jgi:hypothetical protein
MYFLNVFERIYSSRYNSLMAATFKDMNIFLYYLLASIISVGELSVSLLNCFMKGFLFLENI